MSYTVFLFNKNKEYIAELSNGLGTRNFSVHLVTSIKELESKAISNPPQAIILDINNNSEQADAIELCAEIRKNKIFEQTILVVYSPFTEDYIQIECFKAGADNYFTKPMRIKLLVSRINALLKRVKNINTDVGEHIIRLSNQIIINTEQYSIFKNDEHIFLPRKEFEILLLLTTKPGKVFTRDEIVQNVWKKEHQNIGRTIDVHIRKIREKLGNDIIKTIKGVGYKMEESLLKESVLA
jgi:two-component system alkaline phosphatase synthesis response regulator PhoP